MHIITSVQNDNINIIFFIKLVFELMIDCSFLIIIITIRTTESLKNILHDCSCLQICLNLVFMPANLVYMPAEHTFNSVIEPHLLQTSPTFSHL